MHKKKITDLHAFVNRELSYSELTKDTESAADKRVTYLYVQNKKVRTGCHLSSRFAGHRLCDRRAPASGLSNHSTSFS